MHSTFGQKTATHFLRRVLPIGGIALLAVVSLPRPAHAQPGPCDTPNTCTIWPTSPTPATPAANDANAAELGVKFRTTSNGWITAIRFYKGAQNTGFHIANLWSANGTLLIRTTFVNETASGWQQVTLPSPVPVTANTTYVASYHTNTGFYSVNSAYFTAPGSGPVQALQDGVDGGNGLYRYGNTAFPNNSYNSSNYWVDVVFATAIPPDTTPPAVISLAPRANAIRVPTGSAVAATFSEWIDPASLSAATFELRDAANALVAGSIGYSAATQVATLQPSAPLAYNSVYTARVRGGAGGVRDLAGNALPADVVWSFTTANPAPPPPTSAPGGPVLVVTTTGNPFSVYYGEILRNEGLNAFAFADLGNVTSSTLAAYDVVILSDTALTAAQASMFSNWVTAGGNLIAMRPDKQLASLLGLTDAGAVLSDAYMLVNTSAAPGSGIVNVTMQFHGTADRYTLNGATSVATLYSTATTATSNPGVTVRSVGSAGGHAAAFTYDLARSVVYTRQGNPAWSGQERDGMAPGRSDDLFFGGAQPNWVDLSKVAIPQADEQQRLLGNLIQFVNATRKPLPRFWYFPRGTKAVVVMTGDDHAQNGTAGRFDIYKSKSPSGCVVDDWQCVRSTSYIYPSTPISDSAAAAYQAQGFEIAPHITTNCLNYTAASLDGNYTNDNGLFASAFPDLASQLTNRTHCVVWSDFDTQPQVQQNHGVRLDTTYYYWPSTWVQNVPGLFTGSGMPMRFTKIDGTIIDVYQAVTQMTDESGQVYPFTVDTLLDRALGAEGYYGAFTANMHTDTAVHAGSDAIVASAQARGVPIISAKQMLDWLDGRNASTFGNVTWTSGVLSFTITTGPATNGIQAMVPAVTTTGIVTTVRRNGSPASYSMLTIKGIPYAVFAASAGTYDITYAFDTTPPVISGVTATPTQTSATIAWTTDEASTTRVDYGTSPTSLTLTVQQSSTVTNHSIVLPGLTTATQYYYRVSSTDALGNTASSPAAPATGTFTTLSLTANCPCSIWPASAAPTTAAVNDASSVELGTRFRSDAAGYITAIRFYKSSQNTGAHVGSLWTSTGTLLGTATFANESASGWQEGTLSAPVAIAANTTYVASYHTNVGFYSADGGYFAATGIDNIPLHALRDGQDGPNGVYRYGASAFPNQTYGSANYWVDVVFSATDTTPPVISALSVAPSQTSAVVSWTTNEGSTSRVDYGLSPSSLTSNATVSGLVTNHSVTLNNLTTATQYYYRVTSADASGNTATAPSSPGTFTTQAAPPVSVGDTTTTDFGAGTPDAGIYIASAANGELILTPAVGTEFSGTALPLGWTATAWNPGGAATVGSGQVLVDGARLLTDAFYTPGSSLEFVATFNGQPYQHVGFGVTLNETPWAIFSSDGSTLYARSHTGTVATDTPIPGTWFNAPHRYRIDWLASAVVFSIDGTQVATHAVAITGQMRPIASDYAAGSGGVTLDWLHLAPYAASGTFVSRVLDAGTIRTWTSATWTATVPSGTTLTLSARFGNTATPDGTWTSYQTLAAPGAALAQTARYVQYRVVLGTSSTNTPTLLDVTFLASN